MRHSLFAIWPAMRRHFLWAATVFTLALPLCAQEPPCAPPNALARYNLQPTAGSLGAFLRQVVEQAQEPAETLIDHLGHEDIDVRQQASQKLRSLHVKPLAALRQATMHQDAEVRARVASILSDVASPAGSPLIAALDAIAAGPVPGLAPELLAVAGVLDGEADLQAVRAALAGSAGHKDLATLAAALESNNVQVRLAAVVAIAKVEGDQAASLLCPLTVDKHDGVALAAAEALAVAGDRRCLAPLVRLLNSPCGHIRCRSNHTLMALAGQSFNFKAGESIEDRAAAIKDWEAWLAHEGRTSALNHPLYTPPSERGRTLVCVGEHGGFAFEVDADGRQTFQTPLYQPWACQGLPDGHRLIGDYGRRCVVEFDANGLEVWRRDRLPGGPMSVQRLPNGNTLVACSDSLRVVEITPRGEIAWQAKFAARPAYAWRLDNGRTMVVLHRGAGKVVEIDANGVELWKIDSLPDPQSAQRLSNGNTLVVLGEGGAVKEFDAAGKEVWHKDGLQLPTDAQRLPSGNTLISEQHGVLTEVDPDGKAVWSIEKPGLAFSRLCRY